MQSKTLLAAIISFLLGGLVVSTAAATINKPEKSDKNTNQNSSMTMDDMSNMLKGKSGDDYDKAFLSAMIEHHEGAVDMAKQSADNAKHEEIKQLSDAILKAQEKEIEQMKQWQKDWGYKTTGNSTSDMGM